MSNIHRRPDGSHDPDYINWEGVDDEWNVGDSPRDPKKLPNWFRNMLGDDE